MISSGAWRQNFNGMSGVGKKNGITLTILFYAPHYSIINCLIFILNMSLLIATRMKNKIK